MQEEHNATSSPPGGRTREGRRPSRGWKLLHQKLAVEIDLQRRVIKGHCELTILPQRKLQSIQINSRQSRILQVLCEGQETGFHLRNYLDEIVPLDAGHTARDLATFNIFHAAALSASDEGELIIDIPHEVTASFPEVVTEMAGLSDNKRSTILIRIDYELIEPRGGAYFVLPDATNFPDRLPHMYCLSEVDGARMWFPCLDSLSDRCTYTMEFVTSSEYTVVCSGDLQQQVYNEDRTKKTSYYHISIPTSSYSIALAVGIFDIVVDPHVPCVTNFCLRGRSAELKHTTAFLSQAFEFFQEFLGERFPFQSYKQVFIEDVPTRCASYHSLAIFSTHLLHAPTIIDQTFETRRLLSFALAQQWFGNFIGIKTWPDLWIRFGLAGHLANLFFQRIFGNNEFRFRLLKEAEYVYKNSPLPLYCTTYFHPAELWSKAAIRKAPIIIYMIEKQVGSDAFKKIVNKLVAAPQEGEKRVSSLTTRHLMKLVKTLTGHDMKSFEKKWLHGISYPDLTLGFWFNRKRHQTEFALKQNITDTCPKFSGNLTVRIHETDGMYDQVVAYEDDIHGFDFPCHSRMRKHRRKKKKMLDPLAPPPPEETPAEPAEPRPDSPLLWIRIDPEFHYLHRIHFRQPERMWVNQLMSDRDVIGQYEAIKGLESHGTATAVQALKSVAENSKVFYRIRMEAAMALARTSCRENNWAGLDHLIKLYKSSFYHTTMPLPRPNDFHDFAQYHIQKTIPLAISRVELDKEGHTPSDALEFLLELLKNNDNSNNTYSDYGFVASLIEAIGNTNTAGMDDTDRIMKHLRRLLSFERLMPSYHNAITVQCLRALANMQARKTIPLDLDLFRRYSGYGYYKDVRVMAVGSLIRLGLHSPGTITHLLDIIQNDPCPFARREVARLLSRPPAGTNPLRHFSPFLGNSSAAISACDRLFHLQNSRACAEGRLRHAVWALYEKLWGTGMPACLLQSRQESNLMSIVNQAAPPIDIASIRRDSESRHRRHEEKKRKREAEEKEGQFVASIVDGKIKIARTPSASDEKSAKKKKKEAKKEPVPVVTKLKIKLGGATLGREKGV